MTASPAGPVLGLEHGPQYAWTEPWNDWLASRSQHESSAWIHSGIAATRSGDVVVVSHDQAEAVLLAPDGSVRASFDTGVTQGHGLLVAGSDGQEVLWIADNGARRERDAEGEYPNQDGAATPAAVKMSLTGDVLLSIPAPDIEAYRTNRFKPTGVAVDDGSGGTGDVWVADGYGQSYVHRFRSDGTYVMSLSGTEGAGRFDCPHAVWVDHRRGEPELYVSDRRNGRLQVFDLEGVFKRVVGNASLFRRPSAFTAVDQFLVVADLESRLAVLGPDDQLLGHLGSDDEAAVRPGFPNQLDHDHRPHRPRGLRPGYFNSPHGLTADAQGNLYVSEWLIGGRLVKLERRA
ncbi:peptidylglycine monooxygenase-like protein [Intrasporangium mesophilum]